MEIDIHTKALGTGKSNSSLRMSEANAYSGENYQGFPRTFKRERTSLLLDLGSV